MTQSRPSSSRTVAASVASHRSIMSHHATLVLVTLGALLSLVQARVVIEPNPNGEVGMMSSENKYFNCKSDSRNPELLSWVDNNGKEIVNDPASRIYVTNKRNIVKLELRNPQKGDSGVYKCIARTKSGQETSSAYFKLTVFNPTVVTGSTNYLKAEGSSMEMQCNALSDREAQVEITWMFGNYDLSQEQRKYQISTHTEKVRDEYRTTSKLAIPHVTKEHDGKYSCMVDTTNRFLSDEKELKINLHVQYKPRFDEKTPKFIWISEEALQQGGPLSVNISCIVYADPVAKINWNGWNGAPVQSQSRHQPNQNVRTVIADAENMSSLTLHYLSIQELKNPKMAVRHRYTCSAANSQGSAANTFEIKVGRIPDSPQIVHIEYREGSIVLNLNESHVEPPIDIYRLEIADEQAHLFNKSANIRENNTYVIELPLPRGEHKVNLFAHNPVGWSENPYASYFLTVVSGAPALSPANTWIAILALLTAGQLLMMEGRAVRFFAGSLIQF